MIQKKDKPRNACVLVAHPDDETLWSGGTIIMHPDWSWKIYTLCRASDKDRAPKFYKALSFFNATGEMADLDDGPEQEPLLESEIQNQILAWIGCQCYDLLISHGPQGEYTRHKRHEETSRAVQTLWKEGKIDATDLWLFAYQDNGGANLPKAAEGAPIQIELPDDVWQKKYRLVTEIYGFAPESWEARTTPKFEAYWRYNRESGC